MVPKFVRRFSRKMPKYAHMYNFVAIFKFVVWKNLYISLFFDGKLSIADIIPNF